MTTWLISRHPGALEWIQRNGTTFDQHITHLDDPSRIQPGDTVIGSLPVHLAADVCSRGASYWNLSLHLPEHARGRELSAVEHDRFDTMLEQFHVQKLPATFNRNATP
ncbi:MAG: CRISPR-associated protein Csx16 [Pseudoxanthomonas sp.]